MKRRFVNEVRTHKEEWYEHKVHQLLVILLILFQGALPDADSIEFVASQI